MGWLLMLIEWVRYCMFELRRWWTRERPRGTYYGRRVPEPAASPTHARRKPDWVRAAVLALAIDLADDGCRKVAYTFNRLHADSGESVGKTFVHELLRAQRAERDLRVKALKRRRHGPGPRNRVWGLDLTGVTDEAGRTRPVLGLVDHGTRANLSLTALRSKATIQILHVLLDAIEDYGRPVFLRTDNEAVFRSRLFAFAVRMLGIRHQPIEPHSPWMNGRIERFFGTLKGRIRRWAVPDAAALAASLGQFRTWYNHIRPHQHLQGRTPAEVWRGVDVFRHPKRRVTRFEAWEGLLTGYYLRE